MLPFLCIQTQHVFQSTLPPESKQTAQLLLHFEFFIVVFRSAQTYLSQPLFQNIPGAENIINRHAILDAALSGKD